jgi:transcription antitermination factor NusG
MTETPKPGDKVEVIAGRHRGSKGVLVEIAPMRGPSGATYSFAVFKRPRAGLTVVLAQEVRELP